MDIANRLYLGTMLQTIKVTTKKQVIEMVKGKEYRKEFIL